MDVEQTNALIQIASSLTTNAVLLLWLWREMKRADRYATRLEQFHDREREDRLNNRGNPDKGA